MKRAMVDENKERRNQSENTVRDVLVRVRVRVSEVVAGPRAYPAVLRRRRSAARRYSGDVGLWRAH